MDVLQQPIGWMTEGGEQFIEHRLKLERPEDFVRFTIPVPRMPVPANEEPTDQVPSKQLTLIQRLSYCVSGCEFSGMPSTSATCQEAIAEIERLQRLLNARPPYYYKKCDCADCGNTQPAPESGDVQIVYSVPYTVMDAIYETLKFYANLCSYDGERTGGVLAGCPRGPKPTPEQLIAHAQEALRLIDRDVLGRTSQPPGDGR
jgi:hypothetical protein